MMNSMLKSAQRYSISVECMKIKGAGSGPAGPVLARPLFIKVKTRFHFAKSK